MPIERVDIETFLSLAKHYPVIDVRSPAEYKLAHIPGAHSLPLFSDEERKVVGTAYKQQSREVAIKEGLKFFGPKMVGMIEEMEALVQQLPSAQQKTEPGKAGPKTLLVHCWRGGMRSAGVAWLLNLYGFKVFTLAGGYKSFRQWAHRQFSLPHTISVVGGYTGSGKTGIVQALASRQLATVDLEGLANHKGSSFGSIGMPAQPSQEMFENYLALQLAAYTSASTLWLEDESQRIGNLNIPQPLWEQMRKAPVYFFNIPFEQRLEHIIKDYGKGDKDKIISAIIRIKKRLGGLETKNAINYVVEDDLKECFRLLLTYYDKHYLKGLHNRQDLDQLVTYIDSPVVDAQLNATKLLNTIPATD